MLEIRFHGRGGHGVKTAALLLAEAFIKQGMNAQAFPEFGPERRGAPVKSFVRASKEQIMMHEPVENPNVVVVLDESLAESPEISEGLFQKGILLINSSKKQEFFKKQTRFDGKIYTIDANKIAIENIGHPVASTVMLGALAALVGIDFNALREVVLEYFTEKKDKVAAEKNIRAMEIAFKTIK